MGRLIFISSGKGGVGKSIFSSNLAATYAERGLRVALIDMNIGLRNLDIYMGLEDNVVFDVADILSGVVTADRARIRDKRFQGLHFFATTQRKEKFIATEDQIRAFYQCLRDVYDIVIIDGPAGINEELKIASTMADIAIIITTPEYVSLRDADMVDQTLRGRGISKRVYIVNKVNKEYMSSGIIPSVEMITSIMKIPLLGVIQDDGAIHLSANKGIPIVCQKGNYIERNFNKISDRLMEFF